MNEENCFPEIAESLASQNEWLLVHSLGNAFPLLRDEIELTIERGKILFGFTDDKGFQTWRVADYKIERGKLTLDLTRNFGRTRQRIRLVPRVSAAELSQAVELARLEKANRIAGLIVAKYPKSKLVRVALNEENGRFAQIIFEHSNRIQTAVLSDVAEHAAPENLLTTAILWSVKLQNRRKKPINTIWILAETKLYKNLRKLHALLDKNWQSKVLVKEISRRAETQTAEIRDEPPIVFENLCREKPSPIAMAESLETSRIADEIIKLAPEKTDALFAKHGETLRFFGLPFARVRRIGNAEKVWFGTERERRILNETTRAEFYDLLENLETYRRFDSPNKRHDYFRLAPEAWLEAVLRRNINLLDGNLILSPIYNQFRAAGDRIDLLALRKDGRLIVIELKTAPDREMIFQAADYWRKIELQRRSGNLRRAKIFGDLEIADAPSVVYLVAPTLSFHRDFAFLSKTVSPKIEIYRFDLNENWRENLKVMKVSKVEK
ncbi:MAG: hypothetical protein AVDCRST_MAG74-2292 [uncultured Pyrinomonadaceae bacterium]|uniref:DUF91 domain-containing protein n=1 Tax=uncultured Pyrinomonadaceae bacterium TaxID=2283094 RepID=A0A6J4PE72_9BACT|nr:MAG: hypothetical protein AVDCRST_MAG74-2292 [uncultured Pyrinomonadaceae bacterium]